MHTSNHTVSLEIHNLCPNYQHAAMHTQIPTHSKAEFWNMNNSDNRRWCGTGKDTTMSVSLKISFIDLSDAMSNAKTLPDAKQTATRQIFKWSGRMTVVTEAVVFHRCVQLCYFTIF